MTESLQKIRDALSKYAPSIKVAKCAKTDREDGFVDSLIFYGPRLAFLASEYFDGRIELFVFEAGCRETPCRLLVHERWHTVAKVIVLLENNNVPAIQTNEAIDLKSRDGRTDTVVDVASCRDSDSALVVFPAR